MKKIRIPTSQTTPGMVVAENVYTLSNQLILSIGTVLTDKAITRLKFYSIRQIHIFVEENEKDSASDTLDTSTFHSEQVKKTPEFKTFNNSFLNTTSDFKKRIEDKIKDSSDLNTDELFDSVAVLVNKSRNGVHLFEMIHCLRDFDDETYAHSMSVSLICNALAHWLNFSKKDIETATLCGLLHDIGKTAIPAEILRKPSKLTEAEMNLVHQHPLDGYNLLKSKNMNIHIQMSAMMHHERCDGSGYPMGIRGDQIDRFAKLVMIADVYEAMTASRVYRGPICPFEVLSLFTSEGLSWFDPRYLLTFTENLYPTYLGNTVRLSNGEIGVIVLMNQYSVTKPVVKIDDNHFLDLTKENNLYIKELL